jgi:hypothetical protein
MRLLADKRVAQVQAQAPVGNVERQGSYERSHKRIPLFHYVIHARPLVALTAPLIYAMIVPFLLLDLGVTLYQLLCFRSTASQRCGGLTI